VATLVPRRPFPKNRLRERKLGASWAALNTTALVRGPQ